LVRLNPLDTIDLQLEYSGMPALKLGQVAVLDFGALEEQQFDVEPILSGGYELTGVFKSRPKPKPKVELTSSPTGATVTLKKSGEVLGKTPLPYRFADVSVELTISKQGFEDTFFHMPAGSTRRSSYHFLLFRRVWITAYELGNPEQTVHARTKKVIWQGEAQPIDTTTPAYLRLPGVDCRVVLAAEGYYDTDTVITPFRTELAVAMRPREGTSASSSTPTSVTPTGTDNEPVAERDPVRGEVQIFATDRNDQPISGVIIVAEVTRQGKEEELELGTTDDDGKLLAKLAPGDYDFRAKHLDYKLGKGSKVVKAGGTYILTIEMSRR
jgi:hypothetical protein